jgi:hypothetical protein
LNDLRRTSSWRFIAATTIAPTASTATKAAGDYERKGADYCKLFHDLLLQIQQPEVRVYFKLSIFIYLIINNLNKR